jgi:hypothetical protein
MLKNILLIVFLTVSIGLKAQYSSFILLNNEEELEIKFFFDQKEIPSSEDGHIRILGVPSKSYEYRVVFISSHFEEIARTFHLSEDMEVTYVLKLIDSIPNLTMVSQVKISDEELSNFSKQGNEYGIGIEPYEALDSTFVAEYDGPSGCKNPMNNSTFHGLKEKVENKIFEEQKLSEAKKIVKNRCFFTAQIKSLMELFEFDDNKLDLAKYSYSFTFDQQNFASLSELFYFKATQNEFINFLK